MFELRPSQLQAVQNVEDHFAQGNTRCLVVMQTGTGKTVVCAELCRRVVAEGGRCLVLAHRSELLDQFARTLERFGLSSAIEQAEQHALKDSLFGRVDVVLASKDSMQRRRLEKWPKDRFDLIIVDEAHHIIAPTYRNVLGHFQGYNLLGVTATPDRGDGEAIAELLPTLAFEYSLGQAIADGHLVRPVFLRPPTHIDLSWVRQVAGDLNEGDLSEAVGAHIEELVNLTKEHLGSQSTLVFTPSIATAIAYADGMRQIGVTAKSVHGESEDRGLVANEFRDGTVQTVANCSLWLEGFDVPRCSALALARKTKSRPLYNQMVGRSLRPFPGKELATILDFGCNSGRHELVSPIELFDTTGTDEQVLVCAEQMIDSGAEPDALAALEKAQRIHEEELIAKQRLRFNVTVRERTARYKLIAFDPFEIGSILGLPQRRSAPGARKPSHYQRTRLARYKFNRDQIDTMTFTQAKRLIDTLDDRFQKKLATHRQVSALIANGLEPEEARKISFENASKRLDVLFSTARRQVHPLPNQECLPF